MKRTVVFLIFFFGIGVLSAYAHPPINIVITYDLQSRVLRAAIKHNVNDPKRHYIKKVDVCINGKEVLTHKLSRQDNGTIQIVAYIIPDAKPGDELSVEAYCSIQGKLEKKIAVVRPEPAG